MRLAILLLSIGLQFWAAALAFHLVRKTGRHLAWLFISVALFLMGVRRAVSLAQALATHTVVIDPIAESVALLISFLMLMGVWRIGKVFERLHRLQRLREDEIAACRQAEIAARSNEAKLRLLTDHMVDAISQINSDRAIVFSTPSVERIFGVRPEDLVGHNAYERVHPEDIERVRQQAIEAIAAHVEWLRIDYRYLHGRGDYVWVESTLRLLFDEKSEFAGAIFASRDITERKRTEEALRESEARYRALFDRSLDCVFITDFSGRFLDANQAALDLLGYRREEIFSLNFSSLLTEEQLPRALEVVEEIHACGFQKNLAEYQLLRKDGGTVFVETKGSLIYRDGKPFAVQGIARDITDRKRSDEERQKGHQTLLTVLEGIEATVYVADIQTYEILFMNKHMMDVFGADFTGRVCYEAFRGERTPCSHCPNDRLLDGTGQPTGGYVWETQNPITHKWYINHDRAIRWLDGRMVRLQIASDITVLKEMEQERNRAEEQLRQAQKMESVGRLAGGVAHDFNNMLAVILGQVDLGLLTVLPTDPISMTLKDIQKAAQRSAELTRQLLAFARKQTVIPKVLDLNSSVASMLKLLKRLIGEDIELIWKPGEGLWMVKIDPSQVDQILANLCVNARDAITGVGNLTIATRNTVVEEACREVHPDADCGHYVVLSVSDSGRGMDQETLDHLFEPFFTTKEVGKGTGLGLATVYGIVKQNRGFISVHSDLGKGSTFSLYFPRFAGDAAKPSDESSKRAQEGFGQTVLLVEDEKEILAVGRAMLERLGYQVLTASKPKEALRLAAAHARELRLLITDVVMPEMNGRDLAQSIRSLVPGIRCLFISGYTDDVIAPSGVLENGTRFLSKPFSMNDLGAKVREALEREQP